MDWKVTWMGQHRWFRTQREAEAWAAEQAAAWMNASGKAPVHHVVYQPSGKIVATYGGAGGGLSDAFHGVAQGIADVDALVLRAQEAGIGQTPAGAVANIRGRLVDDPRSRFNRGGNRPLSSSEIAHVAHGLRFALERAGLSGLGAFGAARPRKGAGSAPGQASLFSQGSSGRLFHIVVRNDKTGADTYMTATPVTHDEAVTIKRKMIPDTRRPSHLRTMLVPAGTNSNGNGPKAGFSVGPDGRCRSLKGAFVANSKCGLPPAQVRSGCRDAAGDFMPLPQCTRRGMGGLDGVERPAGPGWEFSTDALSALANAIDSAARANVQGLPNQAVQDAYRLIGARNAAIRKGFSPAQVADAEAIGRAWAIEGGNAAGLHFLDYTLRQIEARGAR